MKHKTRYNWLGHFIILHVYQEGVSKIDNKVTDKFTDKLTDKLTDKFNANNDSRKK